MALGGMTVSELLDRVSSRELTEWMVYAELEPFGPLVDDDRWAHQLMFAGAAVGVKSKVDDWRHARRRGEQDPGAQAALMKSFAEKFRT